MTAPGLDSRLISSIRALIAAAAPATHPLATALVVAALTIPWRGVSIRSKGRRSHLELAKDRSAPMDKRISTCVVTALLACSSNGAPKGEAAGSGGGGSGGMGPASGSAQPSGGSSGEGSSSGTALTSGASGSGATTGSCVPTLPNLPWTSPYAAWPRGLPKDSTFFPIAVWLQGSWHATEMQDLGINIYLGNNAGTDALAASDLAILKGLGMYAIIEQDAVGLANIDDPTIVAWWMDPDEPDNAQPVAGGGYGPPVAPATLVTRHDSYTKVDPTRPVFLGLGQGVAYDAWEGRGNNAPPESGYPAAADIVAFDIYPYNNCGGDSNEMATCGQFWLNAFGIDRLHQWSTRGQAAWTDFETTVIAADTTTGPTPAQTRSEVWLSLIHDANGVIYFVDTWNPTFREDGIFANETMVDGVTALNKQIIALAPELNSASLPNVVSVSSSNTAAPIDTMAKAQGTSLYVFAGISRPGTTMGSFTIAGLSGSGSATVVGENRTVAISAGNFTDAFAANDVHIYQVDLSTIACK